VKLAAFQKCTVEVARHTLESNGPRRFLVADEVGLGKTVIAREIAKELRENLKRMNVMYICPSLEIAGQNRSKFVSLTGIDEKDYDPGEDRLALVPGALPNEGNGFRIFAFTPETSLPGWKPGPRTGRKAERELIRRALDRFPQLRAFVLKLDRDRIRKGRPLLAKRGNLKGYTGVGIERAMRDIFNCQVGNIERVVIDWLKRKDTDMLEFIGRFRSVLALAALRCRRVKPDLVILDEFHRYADLILPKPEQLQSELIRERARVHRLLVDALLGGKDRPAVLLLSATPYRLRRLDGKEIHPPHHHYRSLFDLVGFLADDQTIRTDVEAAYRDYHNAIIVAGNSARAKRQVRTAKVRLEELLRPLMARTERALVHEEELFERSNQQVDIERRDLVIFKHLAETAGSKFAGWAPAIWSSIPYPAQTMQGYKVWEKLAKGKPAPIEAGSGRGTFAHPQLRILAEMAGDAAKLSLPWQPPTVRWWKLEGPWSPSSPLPGKTLLFSRWRGAPNAIAALLSIHLQGGLRKPTEKAPTPLLRRGGSETGALVGLFMPWPNLSRAVEPLKSAEATIKAVRRDARRQVVDYLLGHGIRIDGRLKRPTWIVAAGIERALSASSYRQVSSLASKASRGVRAKNWRHINKIHQVSSSEIIALSDFILSSPGSMIARCVARNHIPQGKVGERERVFSFAWNTLRPYLGHRVFAKLLLAGTKRKRYSDAVSDALVKGGFEAVLDEQMVLLRQLGDCEGLRIIDQLSASLLDRPGLVQFRRGRAKHRVPVQAVSPFASGDQSRGTKRKGSRVRTETLRRAFNSPFWPHMLCTTSIGQEGLDFHLWCSRIVHWDLPKDPIDFEQREGRIARYGSLAVRRSLALKHSARIPSQRGTESPFSNLISLAQELEDGRTGLESWWLPESERPTSVSFDWRFSLRAARRERLLRDLLYYRLALGQPDPDAFVSMLDRMGADKGVARSLALDLSAISRFPVP
jgi:hypothetical protein